MKDIRIAIIGVGNCSSSLVQGLFYYKNVDSSKNVNGLMHNKIGDYKISDIKPVVAFEVDERKVGFDLSKAIFSEPNCTKKICDVPNLDAIVEKGPVLDGIAKHMSEYPENKRFVVSEKEAVNVAEVLKRNNVDIVINYLPVGSENAVKYYAKSCLDAGCAFINCMPIFIASDPQLSEKFKKANLPVIGDDVKSQIGATIIHRALTKLFSDRGVKINKTYQLNFGGNTDFLNMLERSRLKSKKISKTEAVQSQLHTPLETNNIHIGPSDYIPWQNDNKICFIRIEGKNFGDVPVDLELRLSVEDSPNSAGCVIDAIRCCKLALDRNISGPLISISVYTMKHPPIQYPDNEAKNMVEEFITGKRLL